MWLDSLSFAYVYGFTTKEQREILEIVRANAAMLRTAWDEFHSGRG